MGKITQFFESRTGKIVRSAFFLALFLYLIISHIAQWPGMKHIVLFVFFVLGFLGELSDLIEVLKAKSKDS